MRVGHGTWRGVGFGFCTAVLAFASIAGARTPGARSAGLSSTHPAAACADDPYEPDDTKESAGTIEVGMAQHRVLCDEDWVAFRSRHRSFNATPFLRVAADSYIAIETKNLTGGADTALQLYAESY